MIHRMCRDIMRRFSGSGSAWRSGSRRGVLERMWAKAGKMVVVTEVHDQEKKDEHMAYRRKCVENYDEVYAGLDKTFYTREMFLQFAEEHGGRCEIVQPDNELYWNNRFVFDCYLYKE